LLAHIADAHESLIELHERTRSAGKPEPERAARQSDLPSDGSQTL
jgi:hypothetical protein